jgi:hypothetical protein
VEEILRDLARLNQRAAGLAKLLTAIERAAPARSQGIDRTGMVQAVLGPDGVPEAIQVHGNWRERLPAASFAGAVAQACQAAMHERVQAWTRVLADAGWQERFDRLRHDSGAATADPGPPPVPPAFRRADGARTRDPGSLIEEVISRHDATSQAMTAQAQAPPQGTGATPGRTVVLTLLAGGRVNCQADPRWVDQQMGATLTRALGQALASARQDLARASGEHSRGAAEPDGLTAELLAAMNDEMRPSPEHEGDVA